MYCTLILIDKPVKIYLPNLFHSEDLTRDLEIIPDTTLLCKVSLLPFHIWGREWQEEGGTRIC